MNRKFTYMYFSLATFAAVAFRLFLLLFATDTESGFIKPEYIASATFMIILIALAVTLIFVFSLRSSVSSFKQTVSPSIANKTVSFILGVSVFFETMFSPLSDMLHPTIQNLDLILGFATLVVLICSAFRKEFKINFNPLLNVVPLIFFIVRLIGIFKIFSAFSMIVDIVFELVALCALLVGFLFFAKCENFAQEGIKTTPTFAAILFSGSLGITASLPKIILNLTDNAEYIHINSVPMYSVFFASVFLLIYSIEHFGFNSNAK